MRIPDSVIMRKCAKCDEDGKKVLQTKETTGQRPVTQGQEIPPIVEEVLRSLVRRACRLSFNFVF
jgi:hypothetical protein